MERVLSCNKRNFLDPPLHLAVFLAVTLYRIRSISVYTEKRTHEANFCRSSHLAQLEYSN